MAKKRIDVHHHLLTPAYLEELAKVGVREAGGVPFPHWNPEESLGFMDRAHIDTALLSLSSPGLCLGNPTREQGLARALNEFAAQTVMRWPERFGFFASLPLPDVDAALAEISYALDILHADGIGLLSNYAGIYLGDARFDPIFAELDRRAAVLFIHPTVFTGNDIPSARNAGSPVPTLPGFILEFVFDTTRAVANLVMSETLKKYPHLRIILSHAGGTVPFVAQRIASGILYATFASQMTAGPVALPREQIEAIRQAFTQDVLNQLRELYYDTALSATGNVFGSLQQLVPTSHVLFGTDYPFAPEMESGSTATRLEALPGLNEQAILEIESHNALQLFSRLQS